MGGCNGYVVVLLSTSHLFIGEYNFQTTPQPMPFLSHFVILELEPKEGNEESNKGEDKTGKRKQAPGGEEMKRSRFSVSHTGSSLCT